MDEHWGVFLSYARADAAQVHRLAENRRMADRSRHNRPHETATVRTCANLCRPH